MRWLINFITVWGLITKSMRVHRLHFPLKPEIYGYQCQRMTWKISKFQNMCEKFCFGFVHEIKKCLYTARAFISLSNQHHLIISPYCLKAKYVSSTMNQQWNISVPPEPNGLKKNYRFVCLHSELLLTEDIAIHNSCDIRYIIFIYMTIWIISLFCIISC